MRKPKQPVTSNSALSDREFMSKLIVGIGEVAEITQIPQRQLRYWLQKGIIQASAGGNTSSTRRFNCMEIKKILLIKELLDEGFTLEAAASKVEKRCAIIDTAFDKLKKNKQRAK